MAMNALDFDSVELDTLKQFADQSDDSLGILVGADASIAAWLPTWPVGFQNSAAGADQPFYAVISYSLMRPPSTGRRLIRS
ncbi:hypothetical protein ABZW30_21780 [Kitasatospora sp. NPDC004669]|uniref:hypothetical protein n=1 Tax=Kitasatospora sp. NPDC004669 TaxID=3154555 RepID=UPI0033A4E3FB